MCKVFKRGLSLVLCLSMLLGFFTSGICSIKADAATFSPRLTAPSYSTYYKPQSSYNPFTVNYNAYGGNCTWYAWGRAYEITGAYPKLGRGNAGTWWGYNKSGGYYSYGSTPKLGAVACWSNSGAGHVGIVEQINSDGTIVISESGWSSCYFRTVNIPSSGYRSGLTFQGYIYIGAFELDTSIPEPVINLKCNKTVYNSSESISFTWDVSKGAQEYWIYLWKDGTQLYSYNCGNNTSFTQAPSNPGMYTLIIRPGNSNGFNDASTSVSFIVTNDIPDAVTNINSDKHIYNSTESVHFNWEPAYGAETYWVYLWKDGVQLYAYECGNTTSFTQAPSSTGNYTLIIRPGNVNGFNDGSKSCSFIVTNDVPESVVNLRSDKKVYTTTESIHFEWDEAYGAETYWIYLWKDGTQLYSYNCGNSTSFTQAPSSQGSYTLVIRPANMNGFNNSSLNYSFVVSNGFLIEYNSNGGTGAPTCQNKIYDVDLTLSSIIPSKNGHTFLGWSTDSSATSVEYYAGDIYSKNKDITLYAVWQKNPVITYTLSYDANGGANRPANQTGEISYTISSTKPTRNDYTFLGWAKISSATTASYKAGDTITLTENTTLYAVWQKNPVVTPPIEENTATIAIENNNGSKIINYGETLKLTAMVSDMPVDSKICWYIDGIKKGEGETFNVSFESGTKSIEVKLVDSKDNVIKNSNGDEIKDTQTVTVKAGFFQKLISFFKNLFGLNRTVIQAIFEDII